MRMVIQLFVLSGGWPEHISRITGQETRLGNGTQVGRHRSPFTDRKSLYLHLARGPKDISDRET